MRQKPVFSISRSAGGHVKCYYDTYTSLYDIRNLKKCRKAIELLKIVQKRFRKHLEQFILS